MNWPTNKLRTLCEGFGELSPSCHHAVRLQSEALDHALTIRQRLGLRFHLFLCKWCRRYGKHITFLRGAAREDVSELESASQILSPGTRERIRRRLHSEAEWPRT